MHIVITGGSGFLGKSLIHALENDRKISITNVDMTNSVHGSRIFFIKSSLFSQNEVDRVFRVVRKRNPGEVVVIHLAGMADRGLCERFPLKALVLNVTLTMHVLLLAEKYGFKKFIFPSSALVYPQDKGIALKEDYQVLPLSVYAATKVVAEELIRSFCLKSIISCVVVRFANIYGATSNRKTLFGSLLWQIKSGRNSIVLSKPNSRKDYIYLEDAVTFLLKAAKNRQRRKFEIFNVSAGCSYSAVEIARKVCKYAGLKETPVICKDKRKSNINIILSNKKAGRYLHWKPLYDVDRGIRASVDKNSGRSVKK